MADGMNGAGIIDLPMNKDEWQECVIVEDIGEQNEHEDQFYRFGDYGVEACRHGYSDMTPDYEAYVIHDGKPFRIAQNCGSFEAAVAAIMHEMSSKRLEEGAFKGEDIAKSSITDMIAKNQESRKVPIRSEGPKMPDIADGRLMTPRANYRTVHIGDGRDAVMPKDIKQTDGAPGCSSEKVRLKHH